ncbi:preprotein translocase subunit SecG [Pontibacter sp. JH31]|uniref:Protein-export membrane protein SecG n=1 Tax=Pontibacter aquaedesilientis TaxID=2766980 RepID=A0ABR7XD86_9BACT|nr:preprotein translocase subunit SecG [Pontibacter aquaedesilientis]MBD1396265.1 preprotein translocase subunit SecG [Pontibacter aquaedesilientis]
MYIALISIIVFICVLLILVVLAQNPKGGGLSSQFGGGGASQLMGVKRTGDLLEKLTWGFAIALVVLTLGTHMMIDTTNDSSMMNRSVNEERARQSGMPAAPAALPGAEAEEDMSIPDAGDIPVMTDTAN